MPAKICGRLATDKRISQRRVSRGLSDYADCQIRRIVGLRRLRGLRNIARFRGLRMLGGLCKLWLFIAIFNFGLAGKRRALKVFSSASPVAEILLESSAQDFRRRRGGGFERFF